MTPAQREAWFKYHPPTDETRPKYAAIRDAESAFVAAVTAAAYENLSTSALYEEISRQALRMADTIDANAPDCADKTAAIRCVRLARNFFNEWATQRALPAEQWSWHDIRVLFAAGELELCKARMQANAAIACGGV